MAAVMKQQPIRDEIEGRGHELLQLWALHRRGGERDGLPRVTGGGWSEPMAAEHINEPESVLAIDRILAGLFRAGYEHTVEITKRYYLAGRPVWHIAEAMRRTEGFVALTLRGVCSLVEDRVTE